KDFSGISPLVARIAWGGVRLAGRGHRLFRHVFSPDPGRAFDLLVKEIGWTSQIERIVRGLAPELIVILRDPCAVVGSILRGLRLGMFEDGDRATLVRNNEPAYAR